MDPSGSMEYMCHQCRKDRGRASPRLSGVQEQKATARSSARWEIHAEIWSKNLKGRDHLDDPGVEGRIISE